MIADEQHFRMHSCLVDCVLKTQIKTMNIKAIVCALLFSAAVSHAKDAVVTESALVGHWKLASAKPDSPKLAAAVDGAPQFTFKSDGTVLVQSPNGQSEGHIVSAKYRVADGLVFITHGDRKEEASKCIMRDGALVIFPTHGPFTEEVFQRLVE